MPAHLKFSENLPPSAAEGMAFDPDRLDRDHSRDVRKYVEFWSGIRHAPLPVERFGDFEEVWMDLGAGSGGLFIELARRQPRTLHIAVERDRMRGKALEKRAAREERGNLCGVRGNIISLLINAIPENALSRLYLLYPCPWPKLAHRKNRWYLHPIMPFLVRALKPGGLLIWASDQRFYIDEARYISTRHYPLRELSYGELRPNEWNHLQEFPHGRTNFERDFLSVGHPCHELITEKV